jgi:TRAP-type C4-dicarboxylate transport system permease small subunit
MRTIVTAVEHLLGKIDVAVRAFVVLALLAMTALLFLNSVGRSVLNVSFVGGPALARLIVIWMTFLGAYLAVRLGAHITVDIVRQVLSERLLRVLPIPVGVIGALTTGWVAWLGAEFTVTRFAAEQIDPMLEIPTAYFYLPVPIGCALMAIAFAQIAMAAVLDLPAAENETEAR